MVVRVGMPLLGALALIVAIRALFPASPAFWVLDSATVAGLTWSGQLWYFGQCLDPDTSATRPWRRLFGLANVLTVFRSALYSIVAGFVAIPPDTRLVWIPALAYGTGVVLDKIDGTVARTIGSETALGQRLDVAVDTFGFVAAPVVAVSWNVLPVYYLSLSAARYVYRGGLAWRRYTDRPLFAEPDSDLGRYMAAGQMVFLTGVLMPTAPRDLVWTVAPILLAASLAVFVRDYLVVTGRLSRHRQ